jgi:hypothetical protein
MRSKQRIEDVVSLISIRSKKFKILKNIQKTHKTMNSLKPWAPAILKLLDNSCFVSLKNIDSICMWPKYTCLIMPTCTAMLQTSI